MLCLLNASQHHDQVSPIVFPELQQTLRTQMFVQWFAGNSGRICHMLIYTQLLLGADLQDEVSCKSWQLVTASMIKVVA
jgi:hypothetical protein